MPTLLGDESRICVQFREGDDPDALGLELGTLPGGRYARVRLSRRTARDPNASSGRRSRNALGALTATARASIEFYRHRDIPNVLRPGSPPRRVSKRSIPAAATPTTGNYADSDTCPRRRQLPVRFDPPQTAEQPAEKGRAGGPGPRDHWVTQPQKRRDASSRRASPIWRCDHRRRDHVHVGYRRFAIVLREQKWRGLDRDIGDGAYHEQLNVGPKMSLLARWRRVFRRSIHSSTPRFLATYIKRNGGVSGAPKTAFLGTGLGDRFEVVRGGSRVFEDAVRWVEELLFYRESAQVSTVRWPRSRSPNLHGKEGVNGSSPLEGSQKAPEIRGFSLGSLCRLTNTLCHGSFCGTVRFQCPSAATALLSTAGVEPFPKPRALVQFRAGASAVTL